MKPLESPENDGFRVERGVIRRDFIPPVPLGTIILKPFVVTGYSKDCDGSALAEIAAIDYNGETTGWTEHSISLYPESCLVLESADELKTIFGE